MARRRSGESVMDTPSAAQEQANQGPVETSGREAQQGPTYDQIARRAYEIYQERGGTEGQDIDDWLRAERELREERERFESREREESRRGR
jgi:hypothetical protein